MTRYPASILVIAPFKDDERMYPHLHDILVNLKKQYDEVIYIGDDPQYRYHLEIDRLFLDYFNTDDTTKQSYFQSIIKSKISELEVNRTSYINYLKSINFTQPRFLVLAIDDNAFNVAIEAFPDNTIYWSFDPLGTDCPFRPDVDGFVEQLIRDNSSKSFYAKALIVQDTLREKHLLKCLDTSFNNTIYVPVSLNDTTFCSIAAMKRGEECRLKSVKVVQSGHVCSGRYSDEIARSFQTWPGNVELHFRGSVDPDVASTVSRLNRGACFSAEYFDNRLLPMIFNEYDIGFIGYSETDLNHHLIVNASCQLVAYLRLGMPVICCGSDQLISFVNNNKIGFAAHHPSEVKSWHLSDLIENYSFYSRNARKLFENNYDLNRHMSTALYPALESILDRA